MEKDDDVLGVVAYWFVPAVFMLLSPRFKDRPFVRFHAWQGLFLWLAGGAVIAVLLGACMIVRYAAVLLLPLSIIVAAGTLLLAALGMLMAFRQKVWPFPLIGTLAADRSTPT